MNLVDALILLILLLALLGGIQRGFIHGLLDLLSWLGSLVLSLMCYPYVASWMDYDAFESSLWTAPLVFLVTFLFMRLFVGIVIGWFAGAIPTSAHTNMINKTLGLAPGLVNGFIYAALFATFVLVVPISDRISTEARESRLASPFSKPIAVLEEKLSPIFDEAVRKRIGKLTVEPGSDKFIKLPYTVAQARPRPDLEAEMLKMINKERARQGLHPLEADKEMRVVARAHAADMFVRGYFSHHTPEQKDPFDRMKAKKVSFITAGENLALARNLDMAHQGLMNSPGHRANILHSSFGRVGIGILDGGIYGIMVTQNFRN